MLPSDRNHNSNQNSSIDKYVKKGFKNEQEDPNLHHKRALIRAGARSIEANSRLHSHEDFKTSENPPHYPELNP